MKRPCLKQELSRSICSSETCLSWYLSPYWSTAFAIICVSLEGQSDFFLYLRMDVCNLPKSASLLTPSKGSISEHQEGARLHSISLGALVCSVAACMPLVCFLPVRCFGKTLFNNVYVYAMF